MVTVEPLLERARREPPHWAGRSIGVWDDDVVHRTEPFIRAEYWTDQGSVNVFRVVGTQHWDYQGKTWMKLLETGKRMDINLGLHARNPEYYLATERKRPMMYYRTFDGLSFHVGSDGNHRTCIARFDFHYRGLTMLHGVTVVQYQVDWEFYELYRKLVEVCRERAIPATVEAFREGLRREDTAGWKLDHYRPRVRFDEWSRPGVEILDRENTEIKIRELTAPPRRRLFTVPWRSLAR